MFWVSFVICIVIVSCMCCSWGLSRSCTLASWAKIMLYGICLNRSGSSFVADNEDYIKSAVKSPLQMGQSDFLLSGNIDWLLTMIYFVDANYLQYKQYTWKYYFISAMPLFKKFLERGQAVFSFCLWMRLSRDKGRERQDYKDSSFLNLDTKVNVPWWVGGD